MKTLYLRNVPEEVTNELAVLASEAGLSVSSFVVKELSEIAKRAKNFNLFENLKDHEISAEDIISELDDARNSRRNDTA